VYRRHVGYVFRLLRRFGVQPAEVEDAAQEVFMTVYRRLPDFDPARATIKTWIFAISRGVAANRRRALQRRMHAVPLPSAPDRRPNPEQRANHREVLMLVARFLDTLPEGQRLVFELVDIEGMRGPEASEVLGVKLNTIYTRLRTARLAFKAFIASSGAELGRARG
jgi:RNA polymerase sigma-70 factor (ECF subfamily)